MREGFSIYSQYKWIYLTDSRLNSIIWIEGNILPSITILCACRFNSSFKHGGRFLPNVFGYPLILSLPGTPQNVPSARPASAGVLYEVGSRGYISSVCATLQLARYWSGLWSCVGTHPIATHIFYLNPCCYYNPRLLQPYIESFIFHYV